jgi:hypothetical protein
MGRSAASQASILIASDSPTEAALVKTLKASLTAARDEKHADA